MTQSILPRRIPRTEHTISRSNISGNALKVLYQLKEAGFEGQLVGGCVRDLMLGREPKDFDVVTDAKPEEIRHLFHNSRLIGRRFRLAHVRFGREIIEVATYRAEPAVSGGGVARHETERILQDNVYGTLEEDVYRRDFTVNALYYDISDFSVTDYVGGVADLETGLIRVIGDPEIRYREDPVRMLRAVRFAAKLGMRIEETTAAPFPRLAPLLLDVPPARMFEEVLKLFHGGCALETFEYLRHYGLFQYIFPMTEETLSKEEGDFPSTLIPLALKSTDERINAGKPVTPAFLLAIMLWAPLQARLPETGGVSPQEALRLAAAWVVREQAAHTAIPRRFGGVMREIWSMQSRLERRNGKRAFRLLQATRFRAAYDFLCLRAQAGEASGELCAWWTEFQAVDEPAQRAMVNALPTKSKKKKRRRRSKKKQ